MRWGFRALAAVLLLVIAAPQRVRAGVLPIAGLQPAIYAVAINGARVSDGALLLVSTARELFARIDDLRAWRIVVPAGLRTVQQSAATYIALRDLPGVVVSFDTPTQTLQLRVGPTALRTTLIAAGAQTRLSPRPPTGAFANYAITQSGGSYGTAIAGEVQAGAAALGGIVTDDVAWTPGTFSRIATAWERDDPQRMQSIVLGDTTTTDPSLGTSLRFSGIRWASDFTEQPQFATYPGMTIRGSASVPSALDVFVNDALALERDVPAGPYTLRDLPLYDGANTVAIRAEDVLGGASAFVTPLYQARNLLAPGLASFSYGAGLLDENGSYGPLIADESRRWGVSDTLTLGEMGQAGGGNAIGGMNADWLAGRLGEISLATALSHGPAGGGALYDLGYDYTSPRWSFGGEYRLASSAYASLDPTALAIGHQVNIHATLRFTRTTNAQASIASDETVLGPVTILTAGLAGTTAGVPYSLTAYQTAGASAAAFGLTGQLAFPVGRRTSLTTRAGTGSTSSQSQLEYVGSAGTSSRSVSWDLAAGLTSAATSAARLTANEPGGEFDFDATTGAGASAYSTRFTGGVALVGGKIATTPAITGSYALVRVPGFPDVDVYVNGQFAGKTDRRGDLVTADLVPFTENEIRIDAARISAFAHFTKLEQTVVPVALSGTTVTFVARDEIEVRLTLRAADGRPLAPGTIVHDANSDAAWPVGLDGHVDLIDVTPGTLVLRAGDDASPCTVRLQIAPTRGLARAADAICASVSRIK